MTADKPEPKSNHMEEPLNMDKNNSFQVDRKFYPVTGAQLSGVELLEMAGGEGEREIWMRGVGAPDYKIGLGEFVEVRRGMRFYSAPKYINNSAPEPRGSEEPIDWEKAELWAAGTAQGDARLSQVQAARAYLALRAEVERLKKLHSDHCSNPICEGPRS